MHDEKICGQSLVIVMARVNARNLVSISVNV